MTKMSLFLGFFICLSSSLGFCDDSMNGIKADRFGDFKKNWNFVTTRYRKDSGELRFTYANDLAWEALKKNATDYPDGAVFAKIGIGTESDPLFPSSAVPSGNRRVQLMVKDKNKYKDSNGWGYALFDWNGQTFPGDLKVVTLGCVGCHQIAKDQGYVFSKPMGPFFINKTDFDAWKKTNKFSKFSIAELPKEVSVVIPKNFKKVFGLQGVLSETAFFGTLDEVLPLLSQKSFETKTPVILLAKDKKQFAVVLPDAKGNCQQNEVALSSIKTVPNAKQPILITHFCYPQ